MKTLMRLSRLSRHDFAVAAEAMLAAIPIEIALRRERLDTLVARLAKSNRSAPFEGGLDIDRAARVVEALAPLYPLNATCLKKSLVLFWILRRRGIPAELRLGVRKIHDDFTAHAWLEFRGRVLLGGGIADHYAPLPALGDES